MVSKASKAEATNASTTAKKPVVKREDPVKRLERQLEEARVRKAEAAKGQLQGAEEALDRAKNNVAKWNRIHEAAEAKVKDLRGALGLDVEEGNTAQDYADDLNEAGFGQDAEGK